MARWGVSVFLGGADVAERLDSYLDVVAAHGGSEVFTSLHIPEVPLSAALGQLEGLTRAARSRGLGVVADIAPKALAGMGASPGDLSGPARLGLAGIRLDYGFTPEEVARFASNAAGLRVVLNTSTVDPDYLRQVMAAGADPALLESCHNYYPRPETGLSLESLRRSSQVFKQYGLRVAAFVPGTGARRGPLHEGLPTLERHRQMEAGRAAAELLATGAVDAVLFGDPWAKAEELERVGQVAGAGGVLLRVCLVPGVSAVERAIAVAPLQENRPDAAELVLRSTASRAYAAQGPAIVPFNTVARPVGSVTIDNEAYLRYSGELQVTLTDLPADPRVNVVARVIEEDLPLLQLVGPGQPFRLAPVP
jgi:uncharacterized protein